MKMFSGSDDEFEDDDGSMFGGSERAEEKRQKIERAKEIVFGYSSGLFEKDEEVWNLVKKIKED